MSNNTFLQSFCPQLQPIELFWAAGKNHVALNHHLNTTMKEIVTHLRHGWYGKGELYPVGHPHQKRPVDCCKLWRTCVEIAGTKFVAICDGILGEIGSLAATETFTNEPVDLPIDILVVDLTRGDNLDVEFYLIVEM